MLTHFDVLAGRSLVYVTGIERLGRDHWLVERQALTGTYPLQLEPLKLPVSEPASPLTPRALYLEVATEQDSANRWHSAAPLLLGGKIQSDSSTLDLRCRTRD